MTLQPQDLHILYQPWSHAAQYDVARETLALKVTPLTYSDRSWLRLITSQVDPMTAFTMQSELCSWLFEHGFDLLFERTGISNRLGVSRLRVVVPASADASTGVLFKLRWGDHWANSRDCAVIDAWLPTWGRVVAGA